MTDRYPKQIEYSPKYFDDHYEYRHVILTRALHESFPKERFNKLLTEHEWRSLGVQQSRGWVHYMWHKPELHILLFRRPYGTDPVTGEVDPVAYNEMKEAYNAELAACQRP